MSKTVHLRLTLTWRLIFMIARRIYTWWRTSLWFAGVLIQYSVTKFVLKLISLILHSFLSLSCFSEVQSCNNHSPRDFLSFPSFSLNFFLLFGMIKRSVVNINQRHSFFCTAWNVGYVTRKQLIIYSRGLSTRKIYQKAKRKFFRPPSKEKEGIF